MPGNFGKKQAANENESFVLYGSCELSIFKRKKADILTPSMRVDYQEVSSDSGCTVEALRTAKSMTTKPMFKTLAKSARYSSLRTQHLKKLTTARRQR
jgi:hypothetical protein